MKTGFAGMIIAGIIGWAVGKYTSSNGGGEAPPVLFREPPCGDIGDLDGDGWITSYDLFIIKQYVLGNYTPPFFEEAEFIRKADVNGDGVVDGRDTTHIESYLLGTIDTFDACSV